MSFSTDTETDTPLDTPVYKIRRPPSTAVARLVYRTLIAIFDTLDDVLCWARDARPVDKRPGDSSVESDQWNDEEILRRFDNSENISPTAHGVRKISDHTLVKSTFDFGARHLEASSSEFVRARTTIPIPRIRRTFVDEDGLSFIVMDYIPGERLDHVWPSLSLWTKLRVALTLRRYIRQLRRIKDSHSLVPGPIADSPQKCDGYTFFFNPSGPFPDYAFFSAFYNRKLDTAKGASYPDEHGNEIFCASPETGPFDDSRPLVFTHGDLSMRNIIFGTDGRIWLVDWALSGFYPWWFEYVSTVYAARRDVASDSWLRVIPFIADPLFKHAKWIGSVSVAFIAFR